jgi:hypothetical protein
MRYNAEHFYGDQHRWFIASVVNGPDPEGKVQIRIHGIHSESETLIPSEQLPWATVMLPSTEGGVSGVGRQTGILPSATVFGIFLDGPISQSPMVLGVLNKQEKPSNTQLYNNRGARVDVGTDGVTVSRKDKRTYDTANGSKSVSRVLAMKFFIENGLTKAQAAGICGNLEVESQWSTTVVSGVSGEDSTGLAQWNPAAAAGNRLGKLKQFARIQSPQENWEDFYTQLKFILHEFRGKEKNLPGGKDGGGAYSSAYSKLLNCAKWDGGVSDLNATWIICKYYEQPKNARSKLPARETAARKAIEEYESTVLAASTKGIR